MSNLGGEILRVLDQMGASYSSPVSSFELSAALKVTPSYIREMAQALQAAGLIRVRRGRRGGYYLARGSGGAGPSGARTGRPYQPYRVTPYGPYVERPYPQPLSPAASDRLVPHQEAPDPRAAVRQSPQESPPESPREFPRARFRGPQTPIDLNWAEPLKEALTSGRLVLVGQPIVDLNTMRVAGQELLLRLPDRQGELVPAEAFLKTAERLGLLAALDRWVLSQAAHLIADNPKGVPPVRLHVNLSPVAVTDRELVRVIARGLDSGRIPGDSLAVELDLSAEDLDLRELKAFIQILREYGCRVVLDGFGMGRLSLGELKELPADLIKLDPRLTQGLATDPVDYRIVRAIVDVTRALHMDTLVKRVEDEETIRRSWELGVTYAQGYYLGRPAPVGVPLDS